MVNLAIRAWYGKVNSPGLPDRNFSANATYRELVLPAGLSALLAVV
jgi:hypothetical protein